MLSKEFELRVVDLDPENVGKIKAGVLKERKNEDCSGGRWRKLGESGI